MKYVRVQRWKASRHRAAKDDVPDRRMALARDTDARRPVWTGWRSASAVIVAGVASLGTSLAGLPGAGEGR